MTRINDKIGRITLPLTGFGTWRLREPELTPAIKEAIRTGYRHFDGAAIYENEGELGKVFAELIKSGMVSREEVSALIRIHFVIFCSCLLLASYGSLK